MHGSTFVGDGAQAQDLAQVMKTTLGREALPNPGSED
jgi:hypothetical protein